MNAIEQHYRANYAKMKKRLSFRAGSEWDAEDILQEAYARALKYYEHNEVKDFDNWFISIVNNALRDHKSAEKGIPTVPFDEEEAEGVDCSQFTDEVMKQIYNKIYSKPFPQSEVLRLYFVKGYSAKDVHAVVDGVTYAAAHKMIERFKKELKGQYT